MKVSMNNQILLWKGATLKVLIKCELPKKKKNKQTKFFWAWVGIKFFFILEISCDGYEIIGLLGLNRPSKMQERGLQRKSPQVGRRSVPRGPYSKGSQILRALEKDLGRKLEGVPACKATSHPLKGTCTHRDTSLSKFARHL